MLYASHSTILAMFILYTVAPIIYRLSSSAFYNISLLSSDFYGLLFGELTPAVPWFELIVEQDCFCIITPPTGFTSLHLSSSSLVSSFISGTPLVSTPSPHILLPMLITVVFSS